MLDYHISHVDDAKRWNRKLRMGKQLYVKWTSQHLRIRDWHPCIRVKTANFPISSQLLGIDFYPLNSGYKGWQCFFDMQPTFFGKQSAPVARPHTGNFGKFKLNWRRHDTP